MTNNETIYHTPNPNEPTKVKSISAHAYLSRYKKMVGMALARQLEQPYTLTTNCNPALGGGRVMDLTLKAHAFSFIMTEVFGEGSLGNGKTVRNELSLAGHSVGSFCNLALACESAVSKLHQHTAVNLYTYRRQCVVGDDVWVYEFPKKDKLNAPAIFLSFGHCQTKDGGAWSVAHVKLEGHTDMLEELGMDDIPLPDGIFNPKGEAGTHIRALSHAVTHAPFISILAAAVHVASFVEEKHTVHFGQRYASQP